MAWIIGIAAFLFFLVKYPKPTLSVVAVLGVAIGALILSWNQDARDRAAEQALVEVFITYDEAGCSDGYPLRVSIANRTDRTLTTVRWELAAYRPGFSTDLADGLDDRMTSDRIQPPGTSWVACYRLPELSRGADPSGLEFRVEEFGKYVTLTQ